MVTEKKDDDEVGNRYTAYQFSPEYMARKVASWLRLSALAVAETEAED